jgi:zinc protease
MKNVRDRDGLTYHIYSTLAGVTDGADGYWFAYASFAPEMLSRGRESLLREVNDFIARGITEDELAHRKTMVTGKHIVSLATTGGLAHTILSFLEEDLPLTLIDEYSEMYQKLTVDEVNNAIVKYMDSRTLAVAMSGAIPTKS